jgi:hypothetical protein
MAREKQLISHMPAYYTGFLTQCLDEQTDLGSAFKVRYQKLLDALGGEASLTITKLSEARDFVALELLIEGMLSGLLRREAVDVGQLSQAMNCKSGKGRFLEGIEVKKRVRTHKEIWKTSTPMRVVS